MILFVFLMGLCVGSFLNVLIDRLPKGETVLRGRSHCDHCKKTLRWYELIPVMSFMLQGGRCKRCRRPLSWQYPAIEILTALGFVSLFSFTGPFGALVGALVVLSSGIVMAVADAKYQIIPDSMIITGLFGTLVYLFFSIALSDWFVHVATALMASLFFYLLWRGTRGRGMGFGDVKLVLVIGLFLGFPETLFALYAAFLTGAAMGVILILSKKKSLKSKIAFGPFLIFGVVLSFVFREQFLRIWRFF